MIQVLIRRKVLEGLEAPYQEAALNVLQQALKAPGFLSGEALRNIDKPNRRVVISRWQSIEHWNRWLVSNRRRDAMTAMAPLLEGPEDVELLQHSD